MFFASGEISHKRLVICKSCKHFRKSTSSCGTLARPKVVTENGVKAKLCGCVMPVKTRLRASKCPFDKWSWEFQANQVVAIRNVLADIDHSVNGQQVQQLYQIWNELNGQNRHASNCASCIREIVQDLRNVVEQPEQQEHAKPVKKRTSKQKKN